MERINDAIAHDTSVGPLPEGLRSLPGRFYRADSQGIATDLAEGANLLVHSAWDGSMLRTGTTDTTVGVPLAHAIQNSVAELDASAMAFAASVPAEMIAFSGPGVFDASMFTNDVVRAFQNLKRLAFAGMRTVDYDNIRAALGNNEDAWHNGPRKIELFTVQQFCLRMVELAQSLRQRTGHKFDDEPIAGTAAMTTMTPSFSRQVAVPSSTLGPPSRKRDYQSSERLVGGPRWPECVNKNPDWAKLFGPESSVNKDDEDDTDLWLTPRMAARIHCTAIYQGESLLESFEDKCCHPRLPKIARPFFQRNRDWRLAFRDCYVRIGLRLQKGLSPQPNCTAEEMAFHNIMHLAPDADEDIWEEIQMLPKYPNDDDYDTVKNLVIEDEDVLTLFENNDCGFDEDDDTGPNVDNPPILGPGSLANFMLGSGGAITGAANLHPKDWFLAFRDDQFRNHIV